MREIKFRGKRKDNNEWVYGYLVKSEDYIFDYSERIDIPYIIPFNNFDLKDYREYRVEEKTIGQFTGLYDKNNTPIYEGDLLRYSEDTSEISGIDEVFYNEEYGTFEVAINRNRSDTEVLGFYLSRLGIGTKYEVIGNIYESEVTNEQK